MQHFSCCPRLVIMSKQLGACVDITSSRAACRNIACCKQSAARPDAGPAHTHDTRTYWQRLSLFLGGGTRLQHAYAHARTYAHKSHKNRLLRTCAAYLSIYAGAADMRRLVLLARLPCHLARADFRNHNGPESGPESESLLDCRQPCHGLGSCTCLRFYTQIEQAIHAFKPIDCAQWRGYVYGWGCGVSTFCGIGW